MKRLLITGGVAILLITGCASSADRLAYHNAQVEAIRAQVEAKILRKPMIELNAVDGQPLVISGLKSLKVYAPSGRGEIQTVRQFQDEYVPIYASAIGVAGSVLTLGVGYWGLNEVMKTTLGGTHGNIYYGDQNSGLQGSTGTGSAISSPNGAGSNANGNATSAPAQTITTETTTTY